MLIEFNFHRSQYLNIEKLFNGDLIINFIIHSFERYPELVFAKVIFFYTFLINTTSFGLYMHCLLCRAAI